MLCLYSGGLYKVEALAFLDKSAFCKLLDIDQLSRIMQLLGKPDKEFLAKITSEDVYFLFYI